MRNARPDTAAVPDSPPPLARGQLTPDLRSLFACAQDCLRRGDVASAASAYEQVLAVAPHDLAAHFALYEVEQLRGNMAAALAHQRFVLERQTVFSSLASRPQRRILALCAPGDLQTNVPLDFLIDATTTTLHKLYLLDAAQLATLRVPAYDVIFNAIAESAHAAPHLALASLVMEGQTKPRINDPEDVLNTQRVRITEVLRDLDVHVPATRQCERASLATHGSPLQYPVIIRPVDSHAGHDLEKLNGPADLEAYLARVDASAFFVTTFVDFARPDGFYRKYRIIFVDGEPFAYHLAISPRWMIHYYNAENAGQQWIRDEERAFLGDFERVFGPRLQRVLREVAAALGLAYFGIDCSIAPDGRLLLFEADAAMLVHLNDSPETYPYKHAFVPRIFRAFERMIDDRIARSR
jgi:glutathione synthase/RimK-type ligase-like ATP-grasp enzyme